MLFRANLNPFKKVDLRNGIPISSIIGLNMQISNTEIGQSHSPFFIAEAGVNHNGELEIAKELVDVAVQAGADAVKFQTFSADRLVTPGASKAEYQTETTGEGSQYEMLKRYELNREAHEVLFEYCKEEEIMFLSTPFDRESATMLKELGVDAIKLGSGELNNIPLIKHVAEFGLPLIVSTGMGTMKEVIEAYDAIHSVNPDPDVVFLHCTSAYPCSIDDVHLRAMQTMEEEIESPVGYSDHTTLPETPALAAVAGACVIEKHFTLDSSLPGPDHEASLEPDELEQAIELAEIASRALGAPDKEPTAEELDNLQNTRKGLHTARCIPEATKIEEKHIDVIRPAEGLSPRHYETILGSKTSRNIKKGEPITVEDVLIDSLDKE